MFNKDSVLKIEKLLQPISEENPCGNPADDEQFEYVLKSCLLQAVDEIKSGISDTLEKSLKESISGLDKAFRGQSKDFSNLRYFLLFNFWQHQFSGLRDGITFVKQLFEQHWSHIHPARFEPRVEEIKRQLPFYDGDDFALLVFNRIKMDEDGSFIVSALINSEASPNAELTDFIKKKHADNPEFYEETITTLDAILVDATEIDEMIAANLANDIELEAERIRSEPPVEGETDPGEKADDFLVRADASLTPYQKVFDPEFRERLEKFRNLLLNNVRLQDPEFMMDLPEEDEPEEGGDEGGGARGGGPSGVINNRAAALGQLEKVAQYFEANEPHSPLPFAIREIKSWGDLTYPELLHRMGEKMIDDDSAFRKIARRLNFPWPEDQY